MPNECNLCLSLWISNLQGIIIPLGGTVSLSLISARLSPSKSTFCGVIGTGGHIAPELGLGMCSSQPWPTLFCFSKKSADCDRWLPLRHGFPTDEQRLRSTPNDEEGPELYHFRRTCHPEWAQRSITAMRLATNLA